MARRSAPRKLPVPPAPNAAEVGPEIEEAKQISEFDEFLIDRILCRMIAHREFDPKTTDQAKDKLLPYIRQHVDTALIDCICSTEACKNHNLPLPKYPFYKREDHVQFRVRKLVESVYPNAHKEFIRKKVTGCMITVQHAVNIAWQKAS